jgi:hypothetical protein
MSRYKIPSSVFYYYFKKEKTFNLGLRNFISKMEKDDHYTFLDPFPLQENKIPSIFLIITKEMKMAYERYGQFVSFDFTYNLIKERGPGNRQYGVGFFTGLNNWNRIIPFGVVILER